MNRLTKLFLYLILITVIFSIILYQFDHTHFNGLGKKEDDETKFFHRAYFVICAVSSMGYGDITPASIYVKVITMIMQCLIIISILSGVFNLK